MASRTAALLLLYLVAAVPATVRAETAAQAAVAITGGVNDNVIGAAPGTSTEWDATSTLRPSLAVRVETPRTLQRLGAAFQADLLLRHTEASTWSASADYSGLYELSKRAQLSLSLSVLQGNLRSLRTLAASDVTELGALPRAGVYFAQGALRQRLTVELTPNWRATQSLEVTAFVPFDSAQVPRAWGGLVRGGIERGWLRDAGAIEARAELARYDAIDGVAGGAAGGAARQQLLAALVARWRHDLTPTLSTELALGPALALRPDDGGARHVEPDAFVALRYGVPLGRLELAAQHGLQASLAAAQTLVIDQVTLRGALPLGDRTGLLLSAACGYQHGRRLDTDSGQVQAAIDVWLVDLSLSFRVHDAVSLLLRYQLTDQSGTLAASGALPVLRRNIGWLGLEASWPPLPRPTSSTAAWRADRTDEPRPSAAHRLPDPPVTSP